MVDIRARRGDGSKVRDRKVIEGTERQARAWGERRQAELLLGEGRRAMDTGSGGEKLAEGRPPCMTVAAFAKEWLEKHCEANLHKQSGTDTCEMLLRCHVLPFIGQKRLDEVSDDVVADLKARWVKGGYSAPSLDGKGVEQIRATKSRKTLNNRASVLSSLLSVAVKWRKRTGLMSLPCNIEMDKVDAQKTPRFYEHDTYERLVEGAREVDPGVYLAVLLAGDGGLRRGEIIGLDLADVDLKNGRFTPVRSVYWKKGAKFEDVVKGELAKPIPCTARLLEAFKVVRHLRGPRVLYTDDGAELTPKILKLWIMKAERRAGLPVTGRAHIYRHTFCSHLAMAGVPAKTIQELARHQSLAVTMRYMHLSPSAKDEGISMLSASRAVGGKAVALTR
jgi:integrase